MPLRFNGAHIAAILGVLYCNSGCTAWKHQKFIKPPIFVTESDAAQYVRVALESDLADERREAVGRLAETRFAESPTVIEALSTVARTDESPAVRCSAIRALTPCDHPSSVTTLVDIVATETVSANVRLPTPEVRSEAFHVLCAWAAGNALPIELKEQARDSAIRVLNHEPSRETRMSAVRYLRHCGDPESIDTLINALGQRDFGVVYEAQRALSELTGQNFHLNTEAWKNWRAGNTELGHSTTTITQSPATSASQGSMPVVSKP